MHDDGADHTWFIFNLHTKILSLYLHSMQSIIWAQPFFAGYKEIPSYLEGLCLTQGGKSPSTLVPCLIATTHPLLSNPPHPFPTPSADVILQRGHQQLQYSCPEQ